MTIDQVLYILAVIFFGLAAFGVQAPVHFEWLAFAALALSLLI